MEAAADSSIEFSWGTGELTEPPGPSSSQSPEAPAAAIASTPSRKSLLVSTPLPPGPDTATKLLQECYEACRTWGACLAPLPGGDIAVW